MLFSFYKHHTREKMSDERIKWLDAAKGIGIILVVIGHAVTSSIRNDSYLAQAIYDFVFFIHMPFLFFLSGVGYRLGEKKYQQQTVGKFAEKKAGILLIPYVVYSFIVYLIFLFCSFIPMLSGAMQSAGFGRMGIGEWLKGLLLGDNDQTRHLWYIYILFIFFMITFLVRRVSLRWQVICVIPILFWVNCMCGNTTDIIAFQNMFFLYFWFVFGVLFDRKKFKISIGLMSGGVFLIFYFLLYFQVLNISNRGVQFGVTILLKILSTMGLVSLALLLKGVVLNCCTYLGRRIFTIYLFHQPFWGSCFGGFVYGVLGVPIGLTVILSIIFSIAIPLFVDSLLRKTTVLKRVFAIR